MATQIKARTIQLNVDKARTGISTLSHMGGEAV
jgi:hypothetical protein